MPPKRSALGTRAPMTIQAEVGGSRIKPIPLYGIQEGPDGPERGHAARGHHRDGWGTRKERVGIGPSDPGVCRGWEKDLQVLVDAQEVGDPFQLIDTEHRLLFLFPAMEGGLADAPQEQTLFLCGQPPDFTEVEKGP